MMVHFKRVLHAVSQAFFSSSNAFDIDIVDFDFTANTDWFLNTSLLTEPQFPMIFHSVKGVTMRDNSNPR